MALRKQIDLLDHVQSASVRFTGEPFPRLTPAREAAAYRIAQEALHNALRHGAPSSVEVNVTADNGTVRIEITDDGRGFDPKEAGLGLTSMRDRARAAGGRLDVRTQPGGGTTVRLEVPAGG
jgi:signal transduction histidine kinase